MTSIMADISGAAFSNGKLSLPSTVSRTLKNTVFRLKQNGRKNLTNPLAHPAQQQQVIRNILNLFQRKK
ncbi:MAG: hypothetical protein KGM47_12015 [Acidobacteriota bacterium]|nr:hypothetical protein [Acidobacteriota bacterium]